jgi:DNA-directed RNA polymerase sigma subunit (sigma70/sigma32)
LTTYAYPFIKGAMHRWLEKNVDAVAVTRQTMKYVREVRRMYYDNGTSPAEIARVLKISMADVAMYLEFNKRHLSLDDLMKEEEEPTADNYINIGGILEQKNSTESVEHIVMTKIWLEKLPEVFDQLGKRDRFILGHFYGIYGYQKMIKAELALRLELTIDGVYKARDAAVRHAKEFYHGSDLHLWRRAYVDTKITATKGL